MTQPAGRPAVALEAIGRPVHSVVDTSPAGHRAVVETFYLRHTAHPRETDQADSVLRLPKTRVVLRWVGSGRRVLDLGCHRGAVAHALRTAGNEVIGVDFPAVAALARARYGLPVVGLDLNRPLPFPDEAFHVVVGSGVLDFVPADLALLRESARVLEPGGMLILVVPNQVSLVRRLMAIAGRMPRDFTDPSGFHTLHWYTPRGLQQLVSVAGLRVAAMAKCPKTYSKVPGWSWLETLLPLSCSTDIALQAVKATRDGRHV